MLTIDELGARVVGEPGLAARRSRLLGGFAIAILVVLALVVVQVITSWSTIGFDESGFLVVMLVVALLVSLLLASILLAWRSARRRARAGVPWTVASVTDLGIAAGEDDPIAWDRIERIAVRWHEIRSQSLTLGGAIGASLGSRLGRTHAMDGVHRRLDVELRDGVAPPPIAVGPHATDDEFRILLAQIEPRLVAHGGTLARADEHAGRRRRW